MRGPRVLSIPAPLLDDRLVAASWLPSRSTTRTLLPSGAVGSSEAAPATRARNPVVARSLRMDMNVSLIGCCCSWVLCPFPV